MGHFLNHFSDQANWICRDKVWFGQENETGYPSICQNLISHVRGGQALELLESK